MHGFLPLSASEIPLCSWEGPRLWGSSPTQPREVKENGYFELATPLQSEAVKRWDVCILFIGLVQSFTLGVPRHKEGINWPFTLTTLHSWLHFPPPLHFWMCGSLTGGNWERALALTLVEEWGQEVCSYFQGQGRKEPEKRQGERQAHSTHTTSIPSVCIREKERKREGKDQFT